jgi:hypothetical protein
LFVLIVALFTTTAVPVQLVSVECGPGYSKPAAFGRCRPDPGHSLLRGCSPRLKPVAMAACLRGRR